MTVKYLETEIFVVKEDHIFVTGYGSIQITQSSKDSLFYVHHIEDKYWYEYEICELYDQAILAAWTVLVKALEFNRIGH